MAWGPKWEHVEVATVQSARLRIGLPVHPAPACCPPPVEPGAGGVDGDGAGLHPEVPGAGSSGHGQLESWRHGGRVRPGEGSEHLLVLGVLEVQLGGRNTVRSQPTLGTLSSLTSRLFTVPKNQTKNIFPPTEKSISEKKQILGRPI